MFARFLVAAIVAGSAARADVTFRQTMQAQSHLVPPGGAAAAQAFGSPTGIIVRLKGGRAYCRYGSLVFLIDAGRKQITLVDPASQRFAATSFADYMERAKTYVTGSQAALPESVRQMMGGTEVHIESRETGQSEQILGIQTQAREIDMSMIFPMPPGGRGGGGLEVSGKFETWKPTAAEIQRVPALRELMAWYNLSEVQGIGPGALMGQMFERIPGMGGHAAALAAEMAKGGSLTLRMHGAFFMPGLSAIMEQAKANGANIPVMPGIDTPLFEVTSDLVELNSDPVSEEDLQVPAGYQAAPVEELMKLLAPATPRH